MKTAEEMFEVLGYKKSKFVSKDFIEYQHSYIYDTSIFIRFDLDELYITRYDDTDNGKKYLGFTLDELKAITKQMEELGWL
jgi:glyceraldehyde-3-phosphate dehydrogenase/erythrose-4-phosphate dehydrogenase